MGALILSVIKFIAVFMIVLFLSFLMLLSSRESLCDDIRESTGRNLFQNKRKKNKKYPNRIKWFLLWGHISKIKKWRYAFFIIEIPFCIIAAIVFAMIAANGSSSLLRDILAVSIMIVVITNLFLLSIPWGRYRP